MLHRAMFGSLERFTGIMIEHYAGHLPLWLSPRRPPSPPSPGRRRLRARGHAAAQRAGLRVEGDLRNEKINYKVREHSLAKSRTARRRQEGGRRAKRSIRRPAARNSRQCRSTRHSRHWRRKRVPPDMARMKKAA
jgi:threonyl-tRNA synthetase